VAYDLAIRGRQDFRIRIDRLNKAVRDPLEGVVGSGTVFRSRFAPVSDTPAPTLYTSGSLSTDAYSLDCDTGTVVFTDAPTMQPTMTYYWSNMTDSEVVGVLFAGFHEMEGRWPRRFKLVDAEGAEVLYPDDATNIYVVDQNGVDPPCGSDTFSTSAAERQLLLACSRYTHIARRLDEMAERAFMFREDRGLTVDKRSVPQNLDLALKSAESQLLTALRSAQAKYFSGSNLGCAVLDVRTIDYLEDYEWQTDSRDQDYRATYAGS
jgi:hypothetical protein